MTMHRHERCWNIHVSFCKIIIQNLELAFLHGRVLLVVAKSRKVLILLDFVKPFQPSNFCGITAFYYFFKKNS